MRRHLSVLLLLSLLAVGAGFAAGQAPPAPAEPLRTAGDRPLDVRHLRLDLRVDLPHQTVDARATLKVQALRPLTSTWQQFQDLANLTAARLQMMGPNGYAILDTYPGRSSPTAPTCSAKRSRLAVKGARSRSRAFTAVSSTRCRSERPLPRR